MLRSPLLFLHLGWALLYMAAGAAAQEGGDLQARILYAFEAEDTNQLANLVQTLDTQLQAGSGDEARRYHLEASSSTEPEAPGWGHAEAYLELGRQLEARGDVLGARNWIEKAVIIAPDFKAAHRQLAALVRR